MQHLVNDKVRLVSAQGPCQLVNVLGILKYELRNEINQPQHWEDHLVLGGFCIAGWDENLATCIETCIEISKHWNFRSVKYLSDDDLSISPSSFFEVVHSVNRRLNIGLVDRIYVCRNWQPFNEILLECCPSAVKVCYGDSFGILDIRSAVDSLPSINPKGYWKLNQAYLFIPIELESKSFSLVDDIVQPPIDCLTTTINDIASNMPELKTYAKSLTNNSGKKLTLVTTSNLCEAFLVKPKIPLMFWLLRLVFARRLRFFKINALAKTINFLQQWLKSHMAEREALMYFNQVIRYSNKTEIIIVKPHPRETFSQSLRLSNLLSQEGYDTIVIDQRFSSIPVEFFFNYLNFFKVISCSSSSSLTAKLILEIDNSRIFPFIDSDLSRKYLRISSAYAHKYQKLWLNLLNQAGVKRFSSLRLKDYES